MTFDDSGDYHERGGKAYHDQEACPVGRKIEDPIYSRGGLPLCPICKRMAQPREETFDGHGRL